MKNVGTPEETASPNSPNGLRVIVAEDDWLVSLSLQEVLTAMGCKIAGAASDVSEALALVHQVPHDLAILDYWLHDKAVDPVALQLMDRQTPFVLATGFGVQEISPRLRDAPVLTKPYIVRDVEEVLENLVTQQLLKRLPAIACPAECAGDLA